MSTSRYRLVTRADFDGLVCAALLKELDLIDEIRFVHPKDIQDRKVEITARDITTNVPYDERCHLAFDHHISEALKHRAKLPENLVLDPDADSAARVVYRYYGGHKRFAGRLAPMIVAVDKADAARFAMDEVLRPSGWVLLNFIMDPRTGLGRFNEFRISNWDLLMRLIDDCRHHTVGEILELPDVRERVELYFAHTQQAVEQLRRCATLQGNVVVLDLRNESTIFACNRFMVYAIFPQCNTSIHLLWGRAAQNTVFAIGHSIFNRTSLVNIGELCLSYGGGGHINAGTIQVEHADTDRVLGELVRRFNPAQEEEGDDVSIVLAGDSAGTADDDAEAECPDPSAQASPAPLPTLRAAVKPPTTPPPQADRAEHLYGDFDVFRDVPEPDAAAEEPAHEEVATPVEETPAPEAGPEPPPEPRREPAAAAPAPPALDLGAAEKVLERTLAEGGMTLLPTKADLRGIEERLERIERMLSRLTTAGSPRW